MSPIPFDPDTVLNELSLEEKVKLLCGRDAWTLNGVERLNIPPIVITDGPHGVRLSEGLDLEGARPATVFPVAAAMAATWNTDLIRQTGTAIAREARSMGVSMILGPGINGKRSPLGGRNFEYYSEDPYLSGKIAAAFVTGLQSEGVGACLKHFVGNEQETRRFVIDSRIDERALQEIYLAPFALAIAESRPWAVMGAYNAVNGEPACQSRRLLTDILRDELEFDGLAVCDWTAVKDKLACHRAGLDLEMPGPGEFDRQLLDAVRGGEFSESVLDVRVRRVLAFIGKALDSRRSDLTVDWPSHHKLARRVAEESSVLLKNDGLLPLSRSERVLVIGDAAQHPRIQGAGSSCMTPRELTTPLEAIQALAPDVSFVEGIGDDTVPDRRIDTAVKAAGYVDRVIIFTGTTDNMECEGIDREHMSLPADDLRLIDAVIEANPNTVVVTHSGSALEVHPFIDKARAVLHTWLAGEAGGAAIADILFGHANPSGRLSETFPVYLENNPSYGSFPGDKTTVEYREGILTGYRYYDSKKLPVQFCFGHGLSYTRFEYSNLAFDIDANAVDVTIANTGQRTGKEVVQVYIHDTESAYLRPEQELKGFAKIELDAGEQKHVRIPLDRRAFSYYVPHLQRFAVEAGEFEIRVGASSRDIRLTRKVTIHSDTEVSPRPVIGDTVLEWMKDERTRPAMEKTLEILGYQKDSLVYTCILGFHVDHLLEKVAPHFCVPGEVIEQAKRTIHAAEVDSRQHRS